MLATDPIDWTCDREKAYRFPTHLAAEKFAHPNHWYAVVADATKAHLVPERLRPFPDLPLSPARPVRRAVRRPRKPAPTVPKRKLPAVLQRLWWKEKEAYS